MDNPLESERDRRLRLRREERNRARQMLEDDKKTRVSVEAPKSVLSGDAPKSLAERSRPQPLVVHPGTGLEGGPLSLLPQRSL